MFVINLPLSDLLSRLKLFECGLYREQHFATDSWHQLVNLTLFMEELDRMLAFFICSFFNKQLMLTHQIVGTQFQGSMLPDHGEKLLTMVN